MANTAGEPPFTDKRKRVLILYDHHWVHIKTIVHYLESFYRYSECAISYVSSHAQCHFDLDYFDAVVLHYSVRVSHPAFLSASFRRAIARYRGVKALIVQDEYEATEATCRAIERLGIGIVFTCVPPAHVYQVYPRERFAHVDFVQVLTGYVSGTLDDNLPMRPTRDRPVVIGYRGRNLAYWYGDLGQEKVTIAQRMQAICAAQGLRTDIAWREEDRIYGDDWFRFLGDCKATLATESGSNVFDRDGSIAMAIQRELARDPAISYDAIHAKYLKGVDGQIVMNQVSPRIFEAIACRTALVLFDGTYSGVVEPEKHFIPLRKDFSNVAEVLRRVQDDAALEAMAQRAFADVILSGKYSYPSFIRLFDSVLNRHWPARRSARVVPWLPLPPCDALAQFRERYERNFQPNTLKRLWRKLPRPLRAATNPEALRTLWALSPVAVRSLLTPVVRRVRMLLQKRAH